jgi:hypothetical protein
MESFVGKAKSQMMAAADQHNLVQPFEFGIIFP